VPALPSSILEPLWVQVAAVLPTHQDTYPLGCHRPRHPRPGHLRQAHPAAGVRCGYRRIADHTCSATLRRRRDEWISAGVAEQLRLAVLAAHDHMLGLELEQLAVDRGDGIPLGAVPAPANHRDDRLLAATLDTIPMVGPLPERPVVHLDAGYDYQPCRQALADRGMAGQIATAGCQLRSRRVTAG
jgi:hypothetical protein